MGRPAKNIGVIPGFGPALGLTLSFLGLIVLLPMFALALQSAKLGLDGFWEAVSDRRVLASYLLSFRCSLAAAAVNAFFGTILAWILTRYRFPGRRLMDGFLELPFALPTAVAGIALTALYADRGWLGAPLSRLGLAVAYTPVGITLALIFVTLPFVVRTVQPVLEKLDGAYEEAGLLLGASPALIFRRIILPEIRPALLTGFGLAFARALGKYGSVIFIAGNLPFKTEIAPLMIMTKLEQFNYGQATAVALVMLGVSFLIMFLINRLQARAASFAEG